MLYESLQEEVNNPRHYNSHESGIEAIEITRWLPGDLSNAWKYTMRYEDKEVPKKDLNKLCWYIEDFYNNFIDMNNECVIKIDVPAEIILKMEKVSSFEPVPEIKEMFNLIISIVVEGGILNPAKFKETIQNVRTLAETFSA